VAAIEKLFAEAVALYKRGQLARAASACEVVLKVDRNHLDARYLLGLLLAQQGNYREAASLMGEVVRRRPNVADLHYNFGIILMGSNQPEEAIASFRRALELKPEFPDACNNLGNTLMGLKQFEAAIVSYRRALELRPDHSYARSMLAIACRQICDWREFAETGRYFSEHARLASSIVNPFVFLAWSGEPEEQLRCAQLFIQDRIGSGLKHVRQGALSSGKRLRIAYLSADFHDHATANLMAGLFECHDRERFEVLAFSYGPDDRSAMRQRLLAAFDNFIDVRGMSDQQVAQQIAELGVHIVIDLKGYTQDSRPEILAHRPAPIQVNYLGYPGTMGADFIDYILVDLFVVPADQQPFYTEKLVHLPDCYQVNDRQREVATHTPSRAVCGLPEDGFVFCCFNKIYKITPDIFDIWMRLLEAVPGSVLWLLRDSEAAERNLRREAETRGVNPGRLVFAERTKLPAHLARQRQADLFLDTLPYNAHTTASDALWVGLPLMTCTGRMFPSRVAGSLLHAVGMPELVTENLTEYEALARKLATDPELLQGFRERLAQHRATAPLFDTDRFRRHIESAYMQMWQICEDGEAPKPFAIELETGTPETTTQSEPST
jgi:protein O-GlcNAc transferase